MPIIRSTPAYPSPPSGSAAVPVAKRRSMSTSVTCSWRVMTYTGSPSHELRVTGASSRTRAKPPYGSTSRSWALSVSSGHVFSVVMAASPRPGGLTLAAVEGVRDDAAVGERRGLHVAETALAHRTGLLGDGRVDAVGLAGGAGGGR